MSRTSSRTTGDGRTVIDLSADERYDLLAVERRRVVIHALSEYEGAVGLGDLARQVAAHETSAPTPGDDATEQVAVSLHHVHLPRMADLGVLDYDAGANRVSGVGHLAVSRSS